MKFVAWHHRLAAALLLIGSAATALIFVGCVESPPKSPPAVKAKWDGDLKPGDEIVAVDGKERTPAAATPDKRESSNGAANDVAAGTETAADETHGNPFEVPDGTPAELLKYIKYLQSLEPQVTTQEELTAYQQKMGRAMAAAAEKILAQDAEVADAVQAVKIKLGVLEFLADGGDGDAAEESEKFLEKLKSDERPAIAQAVKQRMLLKLLGKWDQLDEAQRAAALDEVKQYFATTTVNAEALQLGMAIGNYLESNDEPAAAAELYTSLGAKVAESADSELAQYASRLDGMARRLQLLGNEMDISGTLLNGTELDWASYRGKVVLVDFWATWCGPCVAELPNVLKNYQQYHDQGFDVIGISLDDNKKKVEAFIADRKIPWPILFSADEAHQGWEHPMAEKYGITGIPAAILIDKEGKVVALEARGPVLGEQLEKLLGGGAEGSSEEGKTKADAPQADATSDDAKSATDGAEK